MRLALDRALDLIHLPFQMHGHYVFKLMKNKFGLLTARRIVSARKTADPRATGCAPKNSVKILNLFRRRQHRDSAYASRLASMNRARAVSGIVKSTVLVFQWKARRE